jgi:hypothetical protein
MKRIHWCFLIILMACRQGQNPVKSAEKQTPPATKARLPYTSVLKNVNEVRQRFNNTNNYAKIEQAFVTCIADSILPYWYGTRWSFNGTTKQPGQGSIACGYFVATILQQAGVPLHRVATGQMPSQKIIQQFALANATRKFSHASLAKMGETILQMWAGLFIIGLDFHTGFILCDSKGIWFIHARYNGSGVVVKEDFLTSVIIRQSGFVVLGKISSNPALLKKWAATQSS